MFSKFWLDFSISVKFWFGFTMNMTKSTVNFIFLRKRSKLSRQLNNSWFSENCSEKQDVFFHILVSLPWNLTGSVPPEVNQHLDCQLSHCQMDIFLLASSLSLIIPWSSSGVHFFYPEIFECLQTSLWTQWMLIGWSPLWFFFWDRLTFSYYFCQNYVWNTNWIYCNIILVFLI